LPQVKQRRCDPLREYLDEIPPRSAAAVRTDQSVSQSVTDLADEIFSKPLEEDATVKEHVAEVKDKVDAQPTQAKMGEVDARPTPKVQATKAQLETTQE
jgi:hypothetical protein